jgi:hypothetical protein
VGVEVTAGACPVDELVAQPVTAMAAAAMPVLRRKDRRLSWGVMGLG